MRTQLVLKQLITIYRLWNNLLISSDFQKLTHNYFRITLATYSANGSSNCSNRSIEVQLQDLLKFRPRDQLVGKSHFPITCSCALNSGVIVHRWWTPPHSKSSVVKLKSVQLRDHNLTFICWEGDVERGRAFQAFFSALALPSYLPPPPPSLPPPSPKTRWRGKNSLTKGNSRAIFHRLSIHPRKKLRPPLTTQPPSS